LTNDINKVSEKQAIYAAMLNGQGRFLYDFFIIGHQNSLLLDCSFEKGEEIVKKLSLYKLRAKVEISKMSEEFTVLAIINKDEAEKAKKIISNNSNNLNNSVYFPDPRNSEMGLGIFASQQDLNL